MKSTFTVLLIGIAIGILIAPEKGSVTRKKITDLIDDITAAGHHLAEKADSSNTPAENL
jgi:gas vesicle protein